VAIALPVALLGALLAYHVRTTRVAVTTAHELTAVWAQVHHLSLAQTQRVAALEETAAKYLVTRDAGYLEKLGDLAAAFAHDLRLLQALPLAGPAATEIAALAAVWARFAPIPARFGAERGANPTDQDRELTATVDTLRQQAIRVNGASLTGMVSRLADAEQAARETERASILAAAAALLLSGLTVLVVVRSIARPISQLAEGTLRIGEGQLDYRLDEQRGDEFARVAADFNRMAERLGEVDRLKRDFVSTISHDLKTPLASMQETTDLLLDEIAGPLTDKQAHLLRLHRENGQRLSRMLGQLLDLSRLDARPVLATRPVPVANLVQPAVALANAGRPRSSHRVTARLPAEPLLVHCDPDRCRQVLDNLLDNALKFSDLEAAVQVEAQLLTSRPRGITPARWRAAHQDGAPAGTLLLAVRDRGPGIPDAEKPRIFSRFHQGQPGGDSRRRGVGLGLAICREIIRAHGGTIWVDDAAGGGSVFRLLLPAARVALDGVEVPTAVAVAT
jgi:two-component system sensor histidine kinase GlrK